LTFAGDKGLHLWNVALPSDPIADACAIADRSPTRQEWAQHIPEAEPYRPICP
jgi:hypothetical protein